MLHCDATDKGHRVVNAVRAGMSPAQLDRSAASEHGPQVIQKAAGKPETVT
jgi:hypothetical protein